MEVSVADDFYSGEGFLNFLSCNILSIASANLSYSLRKASNIYGACIVVIVSNYVMPILWIICMPVVGQNYESSCNRIVE